MKEKYIEDLKDIKDMMSRSSRFSTLSGLSGITVGIIALIGAWLAYTFVFATSDYLMLDKVTIPRDHLTLLLLIAITTIVVSIALVFGLTAREARKRQHTAWDAQTRRILLNLLIPIGAGGIACLLLLMKGYVGIVLPLTLLFYGLALVNASKYTLNEIRSLGLLEILLGLVALHLIGYSLILWAIGFGGLHILYGILVTLKYKS